MLGFSNSYACVQLWAINSTRSNNLSCKYQRCTPSGCKDIGINKFVCGEDSIFCSNSR